MGIMFKKEFGGFQIKYWGTGDSSCVVRLVPHLFYIQYVFIYTENCWRDSASHKPKLAEYGAPLTPFLADIPESLLAVLNTMCKTKVRGVPKCLITRCAILEKYQGKNVAGAVSTPPSTGHGLKKSVKAVVTIKRQCCNNKAPPRRRRAFLENCILPLYLNHRL